MNIDLRTTIERLYPEFNGQAYYGHVKIFGAYHHIRLIRVKDGEIVEPPDEANETVKEWFDDMQKMYDGAYHTVTVPGLPGCYVLVIFPFAE